MKPINTDFLMDLYRKYYPNDYAASVAAYGEPKPTASTEPPKKKHRNPEAVSKAKKKIAAEISKKRKGIETP